MDAQRASIALTANHEKHSYIRVTGNWLWLVRGSWITMIVLTLTIFFASLSGYLVQLQIPCTSTSCQYQQVTIGQEATLTRVGVSPGEYAVFTIVLALIAMAVCLVVSALIMWRRSDDLMACIVALMLITLGPIIIVANPSANSPLLLPDEFMAFLCQTLLVLVFLIFPSGQFVPGFMRWLFIVFFIGGTINFFPSGPSIPGLSSSEPSWFVALGEFGAAMFVQLYRYRRVSSPTQRQQTKWAVFGFAVPITIYILMSALPLVFPALSEAGAFYQLFYNEMGYLLPFCLPIAFVFAMLRYRLWEIDALINRTLVYGTLTVILAGIYVSLIIGLQTLLQGIISQDNSVAIVISTLAIANLVLPLRRGIQRIIDRRFYRSKYDALKTLTAFSATLHNEVGLSRLSEQLVTVVEETMQPASISLWLCQPQQREQANSISTNQRVQTNTTFEQIQGKETINTSEQRRLAVESFVGERHS